MTTSDDKLPIVILAGSDRRAPRLPREGRHLHALAGYKALDVRIDGRPMIEVLIDRLTASGRFDPIWIAGPEERLRGTLGRERLIDADGTFGENIKRAAERAGREHPGRPIAFTVCDIIPEVGTLRALVEDYRSRTPCDLWFPMIHAPADPTSLGVSDWKPAYRVVPRDGAPPVAVLPCHLGVVDPQALRLQFLCRLFDLAYRTRNRPIAYRRAVIVRGVLFALLAQDLRSLLSLNAPSLTWTVLGAGLPAARRVRSGTITRTELEHALRRIFVTRRHRRRFPDRRVWLPILEGLSLAKDIDTEEEARAIGGDVARRLA